MRNSVVYFCRNKHIIQFGIKKIPGKEPYIQMRNHTCFQIVQDNNLIIYNNMDMISASKIYTADFDHVEMYL